MATVPSHFSAYCRGVILVPHYRLDVEKIIAEVLPKLTASCPHIKFTNIAFDQQGRITDFDTDKDLTDAELQQLWQRINAWYKKFKLE